MTALWPHQTETIDRLYSTRGMGVRRALVVLPTGAGKSVIIAALAALEWRAQRSILIMVHRKEIIDQIVSKLVDAGIEPSDIGVIRAKDERSNAPARVQVASIATLINRRLPPADLVVIDEAHRAMAASYRRIASLYPRGWHVGLTATPYRLDGNPLGEAYDELISTASYSDLIGAGLLAEPRVYSVSTGQLPDLAKVRTSKGDYDLGDLGRLMNRRVLIGDMLNEWTKRARDLRTVIFATTIEHSHAIRDEFSAAGVRIEHLDGQTPEEERERILEAMRAHQIDAVTNCDVLSEGWDMPECKCAIVARPTSSLTKHIQITGRIFRPWQGVRPIIIDHAGNVWRHDFPHTDRKYSLTKRQKSALGTAGPVPEAVKRCSACGLCADLDADCCTGCGHVFLPAERKDIVRKAGELVELDMRSVIEARVRKVAEKQGASERWIQRVVALQLGRAS